MKQFIHEMMQLFSKGESFVLATVVTNNGSVPRAAGAKMLVRPDGSTAGTVGGGILEAQVEQLARGILKSHMSLVKGFQFSGKDAATMDAICGGQVEVLVEWFDGHDPLLGAILQDLQAAVTDHRKAWLVTTLPSESVGLPSQSGGERHTLVYPDGQATGAFPAGLTVETVVNSRQPNLVNVGAERLMIEPLETAGTVYIFGAGHVSQSLAKFTRAVGFWTVVLDDRPEFVNPKRFPTADELIVLDSFVDVLKKIEIDHDCYIVIVTRGHLNDREVLTQALKTSAGYIGMIGSRRKCSLIFDELRKIGFTDEDRLRVHAPIGLEIKAETPEEIGISITAELIKVRAGLST